MEYKRPRLIAETADDLQNILFGEADEAIVDIQGDSSTAVQVAGPVAEPEPEVFSDSDRDSMDEFIVRDTNEEAEQRYFQGYSDRYGEDATEALSDVIAVFGDLRILDIYGRDAVKVSRVPSASSSGKVPLTSQYDPEEVRAQFASEKDDEILATDYPERTQEEYGTSRCLETQSLFDSNGQVLENEWAVESAWIYTVLRDRYTKKEKGKDDTSFWSPVTIEDKEADAAFEDKYVPDHSAIMMDEYKTDVVNRIHVALRDIRGRAHDPLYIWYSMSRTKYNWFLNLEDLLQIKQLDIEWTTFVFPKLATVQNKLDSILSVIESVISHYTTDLTDESMSIPFQKSLAESISVDIKSHQGEISHLCSRDTISPDFAEILDDYSLSISTEIEPMVQYLSSSITHSGPSAIAPKISSPPRRVRQSESTRTPSVATIFHNNLHEILIPLITLSPREIGENVSIGTRIHKGAFASMRQTPEFDSANLSPNLRIQLIESLSSTISSNPKIRQWFRKELEKRACVFTHPVGDISISQWLYSIRRLVMKPVSELWGTSVQVAINALVSLGEITCDLVVCQDNKIVLEGVQSVDPDKLITDHDEIFYDKVVGKHVTTLRDIKRKSWRQAVANYGHLVSQDQFLIELLYLMKPETHSWKESEFIVSLRTEVARNVVSRLYKSLKSELLAKLTKESVHVAASVCANKFKKQLLVRPFDPRESVGSINVDKVFTDCGNDVHVAREIVRRKCGYFSVMSVVPEKVMNGFKCHCVVVNHKGDYVDHVALDHILGPRHSTEEKKKSADRDRILALMRQYLPSLVIVGVESNKSLGALNEIKANLKWAFMDSNWNSTTASTMLSEPVIHFGDLTVPSRRAAAATTDEEASIPIKTAISLARMCQDPTAEILSLWSDHSPESNKALTIPVHDLQAFIPRSVLHREFLTTAISVVATLGVDLKNKNSASSLLKFVPGLGPRKARNLISKSSTDAVILGYEADVSNNSSGRFERLEEILGSLVFRNAQPFIKLVPDCDRVSAELTSRAGNSSRHRADSAGSSMEHDDDASSSYSSSASSSSSSSSSSSEDAEEADKEEPNWDDWYKDPDTGEWKKIERVTPVVEPAAKESEWYKDPETGEWKEKQASVEPAKEPEWYKDPETGEWKQKSVEVVHAEPVQEEWVQDPETGKWSRKEPEVKNDSNEEWEKDPVTGEWTKKQSEKKTAEDEWVKDPETGKWSKKSSTNKSDDEWIQDKNGKWIKKSEIPVYVPSYFGVPNEIVQLSLEGYSYFEMCRFAKECWVVANEVFADINSVWKSMGKKSEESAKNFNSLLDAMFDESVVLPLHLCDPEIDRHSLKQGARDLIAKLIIPEIERPFDAQTFEWKPPTKMHIFYALLKENPMTLNLFSIVTVCVKEAAKYNDITVVESGTGIEGWMYRGANDQARYNAGDTVHCRVKSINFAKSTMEFTTEGLSEKEIKDVVKTHGYLLVTPSDLAAYDKLGLVEVVPDVSRSSAPKTRRIIKHDNYFEVSHSVAVAQLTQVDAESHIPKFPVGEVFFRPSASHPGQYFGMIKFNEFPKNEPGKPPVVVDPESLIKIFRFCEGPSVRSAAGGRPSKLVFKLMDASNEEFEDFDQMKVMYVDRYLRNLAELKQHPKFQSEAVEKVRNLVLARMMANIGSADSKVIYYIAIDDRRGNSGNAVLIWSNTPGKVHEDVIEINNRGYKYWTMGPYATFSQLLVWWKQGGYKERQSCIEEWRRTHQDNQN